MTETMLPTKPVENWQQVRDEWVAEINRLFAEVEGWAQHRGWGTLRDEKTLGEERLGSYRVPVLLVHTPQGRLLLEPIAQGVFEADGLIDLNRYPSFDCLVSIIRKNGGWWFRDRIHDNPDCPWSEASFVEMANRTLEAS